MTKSTYLNEGRKPGKKENITLTEFPSYKELEKNSYMGSYPCWATYKGRTLEETILYLNRINKSHKHKILNLEQKGKKRIAKVKRIRK